MVLEKISTCCSEGNKFYTNVKNGEKFYGRFTALNTSCSEENKFYTNVKNVKKF